MAKQPWVDPPAAAWRYLSVPTDEQVTSATYVAMPTPDRIENVESPTGLIYVAYRANWRRTNANDTIGAAIFLDGVQIGRFTNAGGALTVVDITWAAAAITWGALYTDPANTLQTTTGSSDVTLGPGGVFASTAGNGGIAIFAAGPGAHQVDVRFKTSANGVRRKLAELWVAGG
jgi:hypothetical protein